MKLELLEFKSISSCFQVDENIQTLVANDFPAVFGEIVTVAI